MASPTHTSSLQAQRDLEYLQRSAIDFAKQQLADHRALSPFAVSLDEADELRMVTADDAEGRGIAEHEVIRVLLAGIRQDKEYLRAVAFVASVDHGGSDAIRVEAEHIDGLVAAVVLPYEKRLVGRGLRYCGVQDSPAARSVWV